MCALNTSGRDDRMLGVDVPQEDVSVYLSQALQTQLAGIRAEVLANGRPSPEKISSLIDEILNDNMPQALREEIVDIDALRRDLTGVFSGFFDLIERCRNERKEITQQDIDDVGAAFIAVFLKHHAHSTVNNPALATRQIPADYDPRIVSDKKWLFAINNTSNVLLWVASTVTTYIGAQYYAGKGIQWFEKVVSSNFSPIVRMAVRSLLGVSAAVVTSLAVFKFKERWSKEVNEGQKGVARGFVSAFGSISEGRDMGRFWSRLARLGIIPAAMAIAVLADGATNVAGIVAGVGGRADKADQLSTVTADLNQRVAQLDTFLDAVSDVPADMDAKAQDDLDAETLGTSVTVQAGDGPMHEAKSSIYEEAPVDLIVSGRYPTLQDGLRDEVSGSGLMDGNGIAQDFESVSHDRVVQAKAKLSQVKASIAKLDPKKDIELINVDIEKVVADLMEVVDIIGDMPQDLEARVDLYNDTLQAIANIAVASGAYPDAQASNLALLQLPSAQIDSSVPTVSRIQYRSFDEILLAATKGKDAFARTLLWSLALILGIAATHGNQVFLFGTKRVYRKDQEASARVNNEYARPKIDAIVGSLTLALNSGPYASYFKGEPVREETIRAVVEERINEIVEQANRGTKLARFGRGLLNVIGLGEVARASSWKETEVARMHNLRMDAIDAILRNPNEIGLILSRIIPGLVTVGEVINPEREIAGSTLGAGRDLNDQHLHEENVRLQRQDLAVIEDTVSRLKILDATDDEIAASENQLVALNNQYQAIVSEGILPENQSDSADLAQSIHEAGVNITVGRLNNLRKRVEAIAPSVNSYIKAGTALTSIGVIKEQDLPALLRGNLVVGNVVAVEDAVVSAYDSARLACEKAEADVKAAVEGMVCASIRAITIAADNMTDTEINYGNARGLLSSIDAMRSDLPRLSQDGNAVVPNTDQSPSVVKAMSDANIGLNEASEVVKMGLINLTFEELRDMTARVSDGLQMAELDRMQARAEEVCDLLASVVGESGYDPSAYDRVPQQSGVLIGKIVTARESLNRRAQADSAARAARTERDLTTGRLNAIGRWFGSRSRLPAGVPQAVLADHLAMTLVGRNVAGDQPLTSVEVEQAFEGYVATLTATASECRDRGDAAGAERYQSMYDQLCSDMDLLRTRVQ